MQFPADALPSPGRAHKQLRQRERPAGMLGRDLGRQWRGQVPPPGGGRAQRHSRRIADQVAAVPCLGQREARLPPPHPGPPHRHRVVGIPVDLAAQRQQISFAFTRRGPVKQPVRDPRLGQYPTLADRATGSSNRTPASSSRASISAGSAYTR